MLQRLIHRAPSPIEVAPKDKQIFNKEGRLRDYVILLCQSLKIDPADLYPKTFNDFYDPQVPQNVQVLRFNHYETKRQSRINLLRSKMLLQHSKSKPQLTLQASAVAMPSKTSLSGSAHGSTRAMKETKDSILTSTKQPNPFFITDYPHGGSPKNSMPTIMEREGNKIASLTNLKHKVMRSLSTDILEERNVKAEMMRDFEKALERRIREDERMVNAVKSLSKKDRENSEKLWTKEKRGGQVLRRGLKKRK